MGINVILQDEKGLDISAVVLDPGVIAFCLPGLADTTYACARFIDPYGDIIFNPMQAKVLLDQWDRLQPAFEERNAGRTWDDVRRLIVRCSEETHVYLHFVGD